jgi:hypothetical protein
MPGAKASPFTKIGRPEGGRMSAREPPFRSHSDFYFARGWVRS